MLHAFKHFLCRWISTFLLLAVEQKFGYQAGSLQWIKEIEGMTKHYCVTTQMACLQEWQALS